MLENVRGLLDPMFEEYRLGIDGHLVALGYVPRWKLLNASDFGVPQLRPRAILVAFRRDQIGAKFFTWPKSEFKPPTVGEVLHPLMASQGWELVDDWAEKASSIAPTLVGGSKKHGGPDLGPTRARKAWAKLGVDGLGIANDPPEREFIGMPRLTVAMAALVQGFPKDWTFAGRKTAAYRQVGNAFPPPVAAAVAHQLHKYLQPVVQITMDDLVRPDGDRVTQLALTTERHG
ncbi:hypothetical protein BH24CHL4_BH24CHL4_12240 [soil metagenome]